MLPALPAHAEVAYAVEVIGHERASFADEPVTVLAVRDGSGASHGRATRTVRVVGGPNARGGVTFVAGSTLWAPGNPAGTWAASALPVPLYLGLPKSRDLGDDTDAEIDVAARSWGRVACTSWRAVYAGTTTSPPGDDGISGIYFEDQSWPSTLPAGVIATTVVHVDAQNHIYDADVYVNGAGNVFSLDGVGAVDFRSILTHELGHALGLGHSSDARATMYASYPPGISWRSLEQDDRDGVCALYPGTGDALGCEATPCPAGFSCVARACERIGQQQEVCSPCEPTLHACEGSGDDARCLDLSGDAGRVCGKSCQSSGDCGQGFDCLPTTSSGDLQCVAKDGCASAANPCQTDGDCNDPTHAGWICRGGACVGPIAGADGGVGTDAGSSDGSIDAGVPLVPGGGCSCASAPGSGARGRAGGPFTFLAAIAALGRALAQRRGARGGSAGRAGMDRTRSVRPPRRDAACRARSRP